MTKRIFKRQINTKRSILIPLAVTLVLLIVAGFLVISYFDEFYHTEKTHEASLLAQTYANSLQSALDARAVLTEQFHTTLRVAGNIAAKQEKPLSNEILAELARALNVDVLYFLDDTLTIEYSSDNTYDGWVTPEEHPIRDFFDSGLDHYVEEIRSDTETDTYWMYSYQRLPDGRMIQSGILADKLAELYAQLNEQRIIDQIVKESPLVEMAFIDSKNIITASSIPDEIGQRIDGTFLTQATDAGPTHIKYEKSGLEWYLKLYIPILVNATKTGTLSLLFDLTNTNLLFIRITLTTITVLLILFLVFSFTIINVAKKNKKIFTVAYFDELTGLPNIKYLKRVLEEQEHRNLALIIINPLHFKFINIIYGYHYGDTLLQELAQKLNSISLKGIPLEAYRFTDDQFILIAKNYGSKETLYTLCNTILSITEEPGISRSIDLTIGVVEWQKETLDFETIIKEASIAVNVASETNRIQFYTEEIEEHILRKDTIENELDRIIEGEKGILHLVYQPIVKADDGSIISFEALARMQSSILGNIPPLEFIAIAEERHLIIPLGKIILEHAAACLKRLTDLGFGSYPIGVNISALQLLDETFVLALQDITKNAGIASHQLEIELTESVFSGNFEFLSQQMEKIHALGMRIAIDDFGTGFSSLSRLEKLSVDTLKLDKQFVDKLIDPDATGISSDIISMVHHLGKHIIAEGVETEEQRQQLLDMGCDFMQGYLFSRPVGEAEVIRLLQEQGGS